MAVCGERDVYRLHQKRNLKLSRLVNSIKYARNSSSIRWLYGEYTNVSSTVSVLVVRELTRNGETLAPVPSLTAIRYQLATLNAGFAYIKA